MQLIFALINAGVSFPFNSQFLIAIQISTNFNYVVITLPTHVGNLNQSDLAEKLRVLSNPCQFHYVIYSRLF